ncbi:short-chain dehydrogenase [Bradyrhizobium centrolobii]|uniref:Short-chain dehydrogenase n=1 Tax=Bradyrhizobium centrolobii TaxID=1505087 RepID=A0A176Z8L3_9BRAD|nr:SDR family NAD(P)-dependent oxidoreductase [Bradyrhizobium centrolobii]OAF17019.1 short-chain dehydrogenase [Bradyrhizobium centrolobii]
MAKLECDSDQQQLHAGERSLKGGVALVTGAAGGLGNAIVAELRERGADVHGVDIAGVDVFNVDVAAASGNRDMVAHVLAVAGRLDILVLNAGCQFVAAIDQFPDHEWERLRSAMLDGPFFAMKAAWSALTAAPGGRIVVTASTASFAGAPGKAAYTAAKHGVLGLVRVAALEGAAHGLTVNAVAPGWMDTPMMRDQLEVQAAIMGVSTDAAERFRAAQPARRFVDVREVAATIGFLVSPGASGINGVCIAVTS